ncbi:MAG: SprT family zinc-dependent metalloprotease [Thermoanaerobaculia bacterium]
MTPAVASFRYGDETIRYFVRRTATRKTLGIEVHPDGSVVVRAPLTSPPGLITERVRRRASWISRQLADFARYQPRTPQRQYLAGESHLYLGRQYRLKVVSGDEAGVRLSRGAMLVRISGAPTPRRVQAEIDKWYRARAREIFADVIEMTLPRFRRVRSPRLIIRTMQTRWGSLSRAGNMTLNIRLVQAPRTCIEYVITHELCHAVHRDHNGRFFRLLVGVMPDWQKRKERLESALL